MTKIDRASSNRQRMALNINQVEIMVNEGNLVDALKLVLSSSPMGSKNQEEKDCALSLVMQILGSVNGRENIEEFVGKLDDDEEKNTLMKYIYRGFENPVNGSSAQLLIWHEYTFASTGLGTIVRVFTDRKQV